MPVCPVLSVFIVDDAEQPAHLIAVREVMVGGTVVFWQGSLGPTVELLYRIGIIVRMDNTGRAATRGTSVAYCTVGYACVRRWAARRHWSRGLGHGVCPEPWIP